MTNLRPFAKLRQRLQRRRARRAIARAQRVVLRSLRPPQPGYDELRHPAFLVVMAIAVAVIVVDIVRDFDPGRPLDWLVDAACAFWRRT